MSPPPSGAGAADRGCKWWSNFACSGVQGQLMDVGGGKRLLSRWNRVTAVEKSTLLILVYWPDGWKWPTRSVHAAYERHERYACERCRKRANDAALKGLGGPQALSELER